MIRETIHFKTNTLLKNLVGKDLINDDNIAVIELVKNSYDAGSENVLIRFSQFSDKQVSTESSQIVILDEGSGMSVEDIKDKWLNIAFSEKKSLKQEVGAYLAGNKGIGRFSCDRLGKQLDLLTRKEDGELLHLQIQWSDFEVENAKDLTIQEINLYLYVIEDDKAATLVGIPRFPTHGTALVISKLRSEWNVERLRELKTALEKFLNPNQLFSRDRFIINLSVPDFEKLDKTKNYFDRINGEVQNQIFQKLKFNTTYIETKVSDDNQIITVDLYHEGRKVFHLVERNLSYPLLRGVYIIIYYLNSYKKAYFKKQTGVRSVDFGSVFLFLNGFRIAPYGDRGNDWLGLDIRQGQGRTRFLGSRDIVGRIEVNSSEEYFQPISSREGLKKTPAFNQLCENFFLDILRKLEKFVVEGLDWDSVPEPIRREISKDEGLDWENTAESYSESWERKKQRIVLSIMSLVATSPKRIIQFWFNPLLLEEVYENKQEEVKKLLADIEGIGAEKVDVNLAKGISRLKILIADKEEEARGAKLLAADLRVEIVKQEEKISQLEKETETYRSQTLFLQQVTSLNVKQLLEYHHQINLDVTIANNYIAKAIKAVQSIDNSTIILEHLQKASFVNKRIAAIAQYAVKANFRAGVKKELTDIPAYIEQYLLRVAKEFNAADLKLEIVNGVQELFEIKASRVELSILIDNLISNANKAGATKLIVNISKKTFNTLIISFIDNGRGLSKEIPNVDAMFEMGVTTTGGSGLGLYHAKRIVQDMGGKIAAIPLKNNGMEIQIEVTR